MYYFLPLLYCYQKYYVALLNGFYQEFTSLYGYFTNLIVDKEKQALKFASKHEEKKRFFVYLFEK